MILVTHSSSFVTRTFEKGFVMPGQFFILFYYCLLYQSSLPLFAHKVRIVKGVDDFRHPARRVAWLTVNA